jgi:hypothetical protein
MTTQRISILIIGSLLCVFLYIIGVSLWNFVYTKQEGFNSQNASLVYFPKKKTGQRNVFVAFKINDFMRDAFEVPESIKLYKKLIYTPPEKSEDKDAELLQTGSGEYSTTIEKTDIYAQWTNEIVPNETKILDQQFGDLFNTTKLSSLELGDIHKLVSDKLAEFNRIHCLLRYFVFSSFDEPYSPTEFNDYFATVIYAYKTQSSQLDAIKAFLYKIIGQTYLHKTFINHFASNPKIYKTKDDILFVLNTTKELLKKVKMEDLEHTTKNVYIFKDDPKNYNDKTFSVESLTLFAILPVLFNVYELTRVNGCHHIYMKDGEFSAMFDTYLRKKYPESTEKSAIVILTDPNREPDIPTV